MLHARDGAARPVGQPGGLEHVAADVRPVRRRTGVVPDRVIVDDGYASAKNRKALKGVGVKTVSIGGSKGRKLTPPEEWRSEAHKEARDDRSSVESLMFTLKYRFDFDAVTRRGVDAVSAELLEKVLVYNLCRAAGLREARRRAAEAELTD